MFCYIGAAVGLFVPVLLSCFKNLERNMCPGASVVCCGSCCGLCGRFCPKTCGSNRIEDGGNKFEQGLNSSMNVGEYVDKLSDEYEPW